ncbi:MAG: DUF2891 domain-containing protein [Planctomycetaceae bacterium]|nr:DUF2891 domain-containing protein [Planctomycetaceae bacterium]
MDSLSPLLTSDLSDRLARLALDCVDREYPNHIVHLLNTDEDVAPPRELTPVFFGCFDWHSAVHGHWTLVRLLRMFPDAVESAVSREVLNRHFTEDRIAGELKYLDCPDRKGFERPYGLAWLLQLIMECREWDTPDSQTWAERLYPLESVAWERFAEWLPKLTHPVRSGEHSQTAFALGLVFDWAEHIDHHEMRDLVSERAVTFYGQDRNAPLAYEPSGHDFLSPALAEADLLRRVLSPAEFSHWLEEFLPQLGQTEQADWLHPVTVSDPADGKLAHLDGLNLSRAWMLEGIASGLPAEDPRRELLLTIAGHHAEAGLASVTGEHYAGGHWLGSFAVYLLTKRGLQRASNQL